MEWKKKKSLTIFEQSLETSYEISKKSLRSGADSNELYESSAWFMSVVVFLKDQETPVRSRSTLPDVSHTEQDTIDVSKFYLLLSPHFRFT